VLQKDCPSVHAVADSRADDLAYRRVSFAMRGTLTTLDEVIAVSSRAREILESFVSTATKCSHYESTASTGDVIFYTVTIVKASPLGDQVAALQVNGVTQEATGPIHVGSTIVVFRKGPVLVQVNTASIPPPPTQLATTVSIIAARRLLAHPMP